jgi:hypothetical protein
MPDTLRNLDGTLEELVLALKRRDEEIELVINSNAGLSSHRYNCSVSRSVGATPQTLVAAPPAGTSRIVDWATVTHTIWSANHLCRIYLDNGGATKYYLAYTSALVWATSIAVPGTLQSGPLVLKSPWALMFVSDAAALINLDGTASWRDDVPSDDSSSQWSMEVLETLAAPNDDDWITLVDAPSAGRIRKLTMCGFSNDDDVVHAYGFRIYDIANTTGYVFNYYLNAPANAAGNILGLRNHYLSPGYRLEVVCGVPENSNPSHFVASYQEMNLDDSGES